MGDTTVTSSDAHPVSSETAEEKAAAERSPGLREKVAFLRRPESYSRAPRAVEPVETHMSWVFLTDDRVYKLKKPVHYDFLDFSTLELRRLSCRREVRLNRRLAPDVYLGTVPLTADRRGRLELGGPRAGRAVIDWLVEMRRLPAERMLDRRIADGTVTADEVRRLGLLLARFYRRQPPVRMTAAAYRRRFRVDVEECRRQLAVPADTVPRERVLAVADGLLAFLDRRGELLDERVAGRRIVSGAPPMNRPWVAAAQTSAAPRSRQARAARQRVVPVLIRSSRITAVRPSTSPMTASPLTTPSDRCFSRKTMPTSRSSARASDLRKASARLTPPASGETTAAGRSARSGAKWSTNRRRASRCSVRQRKAFWNAARSWTSSVTTRPVPTASNSVAT